MRFQKKLMLASTMLVFCSCKNRGFNSKEESSGSASSSTVAGSVFLEPLVDMSLLVNKELPTGNPPGSFTQDLVLNDGKVLQNTFLKPDGSEYGAGELDSKPWNVLAYEKILRSSKRGTPKPLAAASVLAIFRNNRLEFANNKEGGLPNDPAVLGFAALKSVVSTQPFIYISNASKPFTRTACGGFDPQGYNDIKWHYYCSIPSGFRACHRLIVGALFATKLAELKTQSLNRDQFLKAVSAAADEDAESVMNYCLGESSKVEASVTKLYEGALQVKEQALKVPAGTFVKLFKVFYSSQEDPLGAKGPDGKTVNMWDYLMKSQPYAFDFSQQQAVLNYYYGQMKPAAKGAFNPKSDDDCSEYRDARLHVEQNMNGKHCDPSQPRTLPLVSEGR